jgi:hypothetical protein
MARVRLTTDLSKSECLERLREVAQRSRARGWVDRNIVAPGPFFVRVRGERFKILKTDRPYYRNDFRRVFDGRVNDHPSGALIEGNFRLHRFTALVITVSCGAMCAIASFSLFSLWRVGPEQNGMWLMLLAEVGMVLALVVIARVGIHMSRRGEEEIVQFVRNTLCGSIPATFGPETRTTL